MSAFEDAARARIALFEQTAAEPGCEDWKLAYYDYMKRIMLAHAGWASFWSSRIDAGTLFRALTHVGAVQIAEGLSNYEMHCPSAAQRARDTWFFEYLKEAIEHALEEGEKHAPIKVERLDG